MKCSHFWRLVSAIVAFAMLIQLIPVRFPHFANAVTTEDTIEGNTTIILGEVESLREEDTKHFRLSNGSYIAVSYGMPVHYEGEDGNWEDIDNTIVENSNTNTYQLNRTDTVVAFANALTNGTVLTTSVDDKTITMSLLDTSQAVQMIVGEETAELMGEEEAETQSVETVPEETVEESIPDETEAVTESEETVAETVSEETETVTGVEEAVAETEPEETIPETIAAVVEDETQVTVAETESDDAVFAVDETVVEENEKVVAESAETQTVEETTASTIPEETEAPTIPEETTMPTVPEETEAVTEPEETVPEITSAKIGSIGEMDAVAVVTPIVSGGVTFDRAATAEIATEISTMLFLQESESWNVEDIIPEKLQSSLLYENVFPDTDLLYTAFGHNIKEQIIVNKPQNAYRYDFLLNLDGMTADLNEDGSVSIVDTENNVIYKIPVPYMEDGGGSVSYDVAFTLNEVDSGLVFTVEADTEWINAEEREFPVKIDPSFVLEAGRAYDDIYSVYTMEDDPNTVTMGRSHLYVGAWNNFSSSDGRYRIFMHFNDMPQIPDGSEVVNAQMSLCQFGYEKPARQPLPICYSFPAGVYEVTTDRPSQYSSYEKWFEAITWRKMPSYDASNVIDYCILDSTASWRTWNITELVKKWYVEDTDNTTVALAMINEEDIDRTSYFASAKFYAYGSTYPPILIVSYRNNTGIEPYYTYATLGGVSAGTAYVADATGQLKVGKEITGFASSVNPFSLNLVYNSDYFVMNAGTDYQPPSKLGLSMNIGSGWTMNYIQKVVPETIDGIDYLKYTDGDGTIHYFMKDSTPEASSYPYYDEDGLGLKMRVNSTNNYTMADDAGSTWIFTNNYLTSIKDEIGNEIKVNFSDGKITSITQKNNGCSEINLTVFEYEGNYLKTVTDYAENIYTLNYTGSNLTSIQKNSTTVAVYTYDGYRLTKMTDSESGYSLVFTYKDGKISSYKEMGGTSSGAIVAVSYPSHSQTTYRDYGIDRTANTPDDILTHYLFDYAGRTANAYTTDNTGNVLGATNAAYYDGEETIDKRNNRTIRSASIGVAGQQLLKDTSLEGSDNSWTFSETSKSTTHPRTGVYSIKGELSSDGTQYAYRASETLKAGTTYTLSAYVNASNITSTEGEGICLSVSDGTNTWKSNPVNYVTSLDVDDGWVRISVTFTAETDGPHTVGIYNNSAIGTFYADDFQLEKGEAPSSYNLIENGSMEMSNYGWTMGTGAAYSSVKAAAGSVKSLLINGDPESRSTNAYQEVSLNMPGSQTYVLSGWVHANAVPDDDEDANNTTDTSKECGLRAIITYSDGTTETHYASFNADISNAWQFVSTTLVPKQPLKTVSKIRVVCAYEGNANKAYFDNISLLREAAQTMTYDEDGNLTSATSTGLSADTNVYDDGNLIKVITGGNGSYTYTYDTTYEHRLNSVTNGLITQTMGYDDVGNVTSTSLSGTGTKKIATSVTYDESGNRQTSVTDAAGNTVEYLYGDADSEMLGLPTAVIDPKDTATTTIYDENGRVGKTGIGNLASLLYTYSEGNLSSVLRTDGETDTQTYSFTYDGFGNMLSAKVGNRTLASYTYSLGNGLMTDQVFGNGDAISFTYDDLGRIRTVTYDDGRIVTYVYNGEGNLHSVTETGGSNSVSYLYLYDDLGRMISSERKENGDSVLRTHQSYNENNQLTEQAWQMGDNSHSESYTYNESDGSLKEVTTSEGATTTYTYDSLRRLSQSTTRNGNTPIIKDIYTYRDISDTDTTLQVETKQVTAYSVDTTYTYQYDVNGNITAVDTVWENPLIKNVKTREAVSYVYDAQNQLIRENNQMARRTWVWEYDHVGNILSRKEYYYTTGTLGTPISTVTYGYGDSDWGDLLTLYDGNTITYDTIGNPLSDGIWNYTWTNGRQLASMSDGETTWNYTYDAGGLRTSRSDGTTTYKYIYSGDKLVRMTAGDDVLCFTYDANGYPESVTFNGDVFYYVTNLQGDVTWITNSIGRAVVKYNYDAWGNLIATDGMNAELQELNPLRYRGYVYDGETGLYYLQSRYYNPEMGRFLNVDSYASTGTNIIGNNMFAYCNNAPMFYSDHSGKCPHNGRFYMSGPFSGQFEYDPSCTLCAAHGEFCLVSSSGAIINMMMSNEQKVLVATIAAEATVTAAGKNVSSQGRQAMANVALNRVGQREWSQHYSVSEICQYTGFDGYGTAQYWSCMNYLNNRDGNNAVYEEIIWDVLAAYNYDITGGCQLYYTPAAMAIPGSTPNWNFSFLEEVCIPGVDSYYEGRFFKYR